MSSSPGEGKARQINIRNNDRRVILKAKFQKAKNDLRAERRRKLREERLRQEERQRQLERLREENRQRQELRQREEESQRPRQELRQRKEAVTRKNCWFVFRFVVFIIVYTSLVSLYFLPRQE